MNLSRREFVGTVGAAAAAQTERRRPNILWLSCEDSSPMLGCYGDPHAITPVLDAFAKESVRYTRAYTVAGVCAPSRSGMITGMYPTTLGSMHMRSMVKLPEEIRCFPEYLREAGYYCTNNAKTDYNFAVPKAAWDESSNKAHWRNRPAGKPFFAVFNQEVTHESRYPRRGAEHEADVKRLKPEERQDPAKLTTLPPYYPDTLEARRDWANVYECLTAMDYWVGDRLRELREAGLENDTIVFFWGDHGVGLPRAKRWLYESGTHVPLMIRIPAQYRVAGQGEAGSVDAQLVSMIDLAPTVLNLAGVTRPKHFQGRAFLGTDLTPPRQYIHGARDRMDERYDRVRMVRDTRYRYLRNYDADRPYYQHMRTPEQGPTMKEIRRLKAAGQLPAAALQFAGDRKPEEELYDVEADPHEIRNLAKDPKHAAVLKQMRAEHARWLRDTLDLGAIPEPDLEELGHEAGTRYAILRTAATRGKKPVIGPRIAKAKADRDLAALERELGSANEFARLMAVQALDELGEAARPVLAKIEAAQSDTNDYVRRVANHAVGQLKATIK